MLVEHHFRVVRAVGRESKVGCRESASEFNNCRVRAFADGQGAAGRCGLVPLEVLVRQEGEIRHVDHIADVEAYHRATIRSRGERRRADVVWCCKVEVWIGLILMIENERARAREGCWDIRAPAIFQLAGIKDRRAAAGDSTEEIDEAAGRLDCASAIVHRALDGKLAAICRFVGARIDERVCAGGDGQRTAVDISVDDAAELVIEHKRLIANADLALARNCDEVVERTASGRARDFIGRTVERDYTSPVERHGAIDQQIGPGGDVRVDNDRPIVGDRVEQRERRARGDVDRRAVQGHVVQCQRSAVLDIDRAAIDDRMVVDGAVAGDVDDTCSAGARAVLIDQENVVLARLRSAGAVRSLRVELRGARRGVAVPVGDRQGDRVGWS